MSRKQPPEGLALVAVLVALGVLLAMAAPFLLSMGHGADYSRALVDERQVDWASASARDALLQAAANGAFVVDETPNADARDEYPASLELPDALGAVGRVDSGNNVLQGEVEDLSRRIDLNSATPLVLANLLGLAVRVRGEVELDASEILVDGPADSFPERGFLICQREVIRYGGRDGNRFFDLERGAFAELGFFPARMFSDYVIPEESLVLDLRTVLAVTWPFRGEADPRQVRPYGSVAELGRIEQGGFPGFDQRELDVLSRFTTTAALHERSARFGKAERVFEILTDELEQPRILQVKSNVGMGPGRVVRIRSLDGSLVEYGMVWDTISRGNRGTFNLPTKQYVALLQPLTLQFEPLETVLEPVVQEPVDVNTADREVVAALFANLRRQVAGRVRDEAHGATPLPPSISRSRAEELAGQLVALRGGTDLDLQGVDAALAPRPFDGWEDFARRFLLLIVGQSDSRDVRFLATGVYDVMQVGCPGAMEMGTMPIAFASSPLVHYRASASHQRFSGAEVARLERDGIALAQPSQQLHWGAATQETLEESFRLDRMTPWWQTWPVNTSAIAPREIDAVPPLRTNAHLLAILFPEFGFGEPRFPDRSGSEGKIRPQPSTAPIEYPGVQNAVATESFMTARHPEGRELLVEGPYRAQNVGPRPGVQAATPPPRDHSRIAFPMTEQGGLVSRHAVSFWFRLDDAGPQVLYDLSPPDEPAERNRIELQLLENKLVFELLDEAGLDPEPNASLYSPERTAATWEVPVESLDLQANTWYHAAISAHGNRPGQLSFVVDGVPRGDPKLRTYTTAPIEVYQPDTGAAFFLEDKQRFVSVRVESTEGFPERGVLRIGQELFEYSSKDSATFYCRYDDSAGGRRARTEMHEFVVNVPRDDSGQPREDLLKIVNGNLEAVAPDHPAGSAVELYGYAVPCYPQRALQPGDAKLTDGLGAFALGRPINRSGLNVIAISLSTNQSIKIGDGFDPSWTGDIELGNPVPNPQGSASSYRPDDADDAIATAFPTLGGYALLVQRRLSMRFQGPNPGTIATEVEIGGVEVIRYGSRQGTKLRGVQRAVALPVPFMADRNGFFAPQQARSFVVDWSDTMTIRDPNTNDRVSLDELPLYMLTVVPISIPFSGQVDGDTELVNWVQLRPAGDDTATEWVRYNVVADRQHLVRADQQAFDRLRYELTQQPAVSRIAVQQGGLDPAEIQILRDPWLPPPDDGRRRIGYVERVEIDYPIVYAARRTLQFRGDPFTGTSSHPQASNTQILPVHRLEFDWPGYGLGAPRCGRGDRVALVQGSRRQSGDVPEVEWHTVNWAVRHYDWDQVETESTTGRQRNDTRERKGDWPFQLVAFQDRVTHAYLGAVSSSRDKDRLQDPRLLDRLVKFPSGELPAAWSEQSSFGASAHDDGVPSRSIVDEICYVARRALPRPLDQQLPENGQTFYVRPNVAMTSAGPMVNLRPPQWASWGDESFPRQGGLLAVDGEVLAYTQYDPQTGEVQIAPQGRGLLGTTARAHDEGAVVQFLEHVPAAILSSGLGERDDHVSVQSLGGLPRGGGTVLIGAELLHYTWTRADTELGMPRWRDPSDPARATRGLLRGRYGTFPTGAASGAPAIWFPFRYWDRYRPQSDDPETAFCQVSLAEGPSYFDGFAWREEDADAQIDLECLVRIDERVPFDADPAQTDGLWLLERGDADGMANPIRRYGQRFEARFVHSFRPGAFDPVTFRAQAWKRVPTVAWFLLTYEGETRVLDERITAR